MRVGEMGGNNLLNSHCQDEGGLCWSGAIHPVPRIILDQYTSTRIIRDQLTHSCINPNTQTFPLLLDWKTEQSKVPFSIKMHAEASQRD